MLNKYSDEIVFVEIYSLSLRESNVVIFKEKEKKCCGSSRNREKLQIVFSLPNGVFFNLILYCTPLNLYAIGKYLRNALSLIIC